MTATETDTLALTSHGFKVRIAPDATGSAGSYTEIGQIVDGGLTLPSDAQEFHEYITNSSPGGVQEALPKNRRVIGNTTLKIHSNPDVAVQDLLHGYYDNRTKVWLELTNPSSNHVLVQVGWLANRAVEWNSTDPQMVSFEFKPAGKMQAGSTYLPS